ncbi:MAG: sulfur carrier protein ThiS [Calditerrivibrio sp.]|nr:sulfur carrier protein ThiS [Calditerrivibrio sp.]MCA1933431.1 sulfur carrier protein ThiS [Calditerrivibrio sp.]MCA1980851.1 sulfur carrier protein ThiS [Calditerrivibrio sp.]
MKVRVNGNYTDVRSGISILELLEELNINPKKVVVEVNLDIVPKDNYNNKILEEGDRVEIVHFVGGG